jgi:hypothetical protein
LTVVSEEILEMMFPGFLINQQIVEHEPANVHRELVVSVVPMKSHLRKQRETEFDLRDFVKRVVKLQQLIPK